MFYARSPQIRSRQVPRDPVQTGVWWTFGFKIVGSETSVEREWVGEWVSECMNDWVTARMWLISAHMLSYRDLCVIPKVQAYTSVPAHNTVWHALSFMLVWFWNNKTTGPFYSDYIFRVVLEQQMFAPPKTVYVRDHWETWKTCIGAVPICFMSVNDSRTDSMYTPRSLNITTQCYLIWWAYCVLFLSG